MATCLDELNDLQLDGEGEDMVTGAMTQLKQPDSWAVHWGKRCLLILEFTRPNHRDVLALQDTDSLKPPDTPHYGIGWRCSFLPGKWKYRQTQWAFAGRTTRTDGTRA